MDRRTGRPLSGLAHLAQSIGDILSTPIGSRVGVRDYGSALFELIDQPMTALLQLRLFAATAQALARWEPRLRLTRVAIDAIGAGGALTLGIDGERLDTPTPNDLVRLSIPLTA